jgi:hypothetical protein
MMPIHDRRLKLAQTQTFEPKLSATEGANSTITTIDNNKADDGGEDKASDLDDGAAVSIEVISLTGGQPLVANKQLSGEPARVEQFEELKRKQQEQMESLLAQQTMIAEQQKQVTCIRWPFESY